MRLDYHMHTRFSDGNGEFKEYVDEAVRKKIDEIGFSDHIHLKKEVWSMAHADLPKYVANIKKLRDNSQISVKTGLEIDYVPGKIDSLLRTIEGFAFDYLMGSVHYLGDWLIDSERQIEEWTRRDVDQVYEQYFSLVQTMAKTHLFDVIGHLDLVKKFNFRPKNDLSGILRDTIEALSTSNLCIEVNTGGLRKPCHEIYPSEKLLKMCYDHGLPITFGSDAHSPKDVGADFDEAVSFVRKVGYVEVVRFSGRKRDFVPL